MLNRRCFIGGLTASLPLLALPTGTLRAQATRPRLHAMIVGINTYTGNDTRGRIKSLKGCLNDADDIERQVRRWHPASVRRLGWDASARTERPVTRADFFGAWRDTLAATAAGDTVLLTYSGHGSQVEVASGNPTNEADGYDETLVLTQYNIADGRNGEHIIDDELDQMLAAAQAKGVMVVLVSDSCHSGTVFRSLDMRDASYRFIPPDPITRAAGAERAGPTVAGERPRVLPNVLFLAGSQENEAVPEIVYDGKHRGALSVGVARCLEAQAAGSGVITAYDFAKQVLSKARAVADNGHHPDVRWPGGAPAATPTGTRKAATMVTERGAQITRDTPIFALQAGGTATPASQPLADEPVRLHMVGLGDAEQHDIIARLSNAVLVGAGDAAALIWDAERQLILNDQRQRIAENVDANGLQHAVDRRLALDRLIRMESELEVRILLRGQETPASDATHPPGTQFDIAIAGIPADHYYCLFNLTGDGQVQLLEPSPRRAADSRGGIIKRDSTETDITVKGIFVTKEGPFGAEHVVAVAGELPLAELVETLKEGTNRYAVPAVMAALETAYAMQKPLRLGFRGIYSRRAV